MKQFSQPAAAVILTAITALAIGAAPAISFFPSIKTSAPSGGTAAVWKIGINGITPRVEIGGTGYDLGGGTPTPSLTVLKIADFGITNIYLGNLAVGYHDVWAVPDGYVALASTVYAATTNTSATLVYPATKTNGNYIVLAKGGQTTVTNAPASINSSYPFEAGETIAMTNVNAGVNVFAEVTFWRTNLSAIKLYKKFGFDGTTTNLVYTCPFGKRGIAWGFQEGIIGSGPSINYFNGSASTSVATFYYCNGCAVPDGLNQLRRLTVGTGVTSSSSLWQFLPGDSVFIHSTLNDPNALAWVSILEVALP